MGPNLKKPNLKKPNLKKPNLKKFVVGSVVVLEVIASTLAWRDLARRSDDQVRGKKNLWRVFVSLNPGNSLIYWAIGRRR